DADALDAGQGGEALGEPLVEPTDVRPFLVASVGKVERGEDGVLGAEPGIGGGQVGEGAHGGAGARGGPRGGGVSEGNPGSRAVRLASVGTRRPAPARSTKARAVSATTSSPRTRPRAF